MKLNLKKLKLAMACKCLSSKGLAEKVGSVFANIFNAVKDFFTGLFG